MLLPLTASALANAAFVLATLLEIAPAPSLPLAARLAPCTKALAQSLKAAEALLATLQASILVNGSDATATRSAQIQEAKANHCAVTGALIGALHRCALPRTHPPKEGQTFVCCHHTQKPSVRAW
jgi:Tfp pilus assembly protein PilX